MQTPPPENYGQTEDITLNFHYVDSKNIQYNPLIRTRKEKTFLFELTNVRINRNWSKVGIFAKYKRNVFFTV